MRGYNDDLVMACAIACWIRDTALIANKHDVAYKKAMLAGLSVSRRTFDTKIKGMKGYKKSNKYNRINNSDSINIDDIPFFIG